MGCVRFAGALFFILFYFKRRMKVKRILLLMLGVAVALSVALALSSCSVLLGGGNNTDEYCPEGTQEYCPEGTHEYEWVVQWDATCTSSGSRELVCKNCPMTNGREEIPMTEHDIILVDSKASTCSEEGYKKWYNPS